MANIEIDSDLIETKHWVDERLASLHEAEEWVPQADYAMSRLREKKRAWRAATRRWFWSTAAASAAGVTLLVIPATRACAEEPGPCVLRAWKSFDSPAKQAAPGFVARDDAGGSAAMPLPGPVPSVTRMSKEAPAIDGAPPNASPSGSHETTIASRNFKESGSVTASVGVEIYLDYECPQCENFYRDVVSRLDEQYVGTGKIRLLYRDFPLPVHQFATLAARYADAAGELGYYDAARTQIFRTRKIWKENGDIDAQVALVLPPEAMEKVRVRVKSDAALDAGLDADAVAAHADELRYTPFVVLVHDGEREAITEMPLSYEVLKKRLDGLLEK